MAAAVVTVTVDTVAATAVSVQGCAGLFEPPTQYKDSKARSKSAPLRKKFPTRCVMIHVPMRSSAPMDSGAIDVRMRLTQTAFRIP